MRELIPHSSFLTPHYKQMLRRYLSFLRLEHNASPNTVEAYERDVRRILEYAEANSLDIRTLRLEDLEAFASTLYDLGISTTSIKRVLCGVRSFFRFLQLDGFRDDDPGELLESPKIADTLPRVLSVEEVDMMEAAIDLSQWQGHRNKAIIEVLFACGLRVSELTHMRLSDLFVKDEFIRVIGKGSKERIVPISRSALDQLGLWFEVRREMNNIVRGEEDYVFLNRRGAHLTRQMILHMVKQTALAAGITKTISPHTFRHSFATALLDGGADIRVIQEMLGHESISTTDIYTHISQAKLREDILKCHPRNIDASGI